MVWGVGVGSGYFFKLWFYLFTSLQRLNKAGGRCRNFFFFFLLKFLIRNSGFLAAGRALVGCWNSAGPSALFDGESLANERNDSFLPPRKCLQSGFTVLVVALQLAKL